MRRDFFTPLRQKGELMILNDPYLARLTAPRALELALGKVQVSGDIHSATVLNDPASGLHVSRHSMGTHLAAAPALDRIYIILPSGAGGRLHSEFGADRQTANTRPGMLTFVPANLPQFYDFEGKTTNTILSIESKILEKVTQIDPTLGSTGSFEPRIAWTRPAVQRLIEEYFLIVSTGQAGWRVLAESIALRVGYELLIGFCGDRSKAVTAPTLSTAELDRVIDFIDAELERNFDLSEMADILDRDPFSFSRSFRAATGESPHQYVIQRRLMRVKEMLEHSNDRLVDITYATGFSNQSHMTTTFSKHFGMPPGAWRNKVRS